MMKSGMKAARLASGALMAFTTAARAQTPEAALVDAAEETVEVPPPPTPKEAAAQAAHLEAQIKSLQAQIDALKKQVAMAAPSWKGSPQWVDSEAGWSFKVHGRFMYDTAYIDNPNESTIISGNPLATRNLGFNSRIRRVRLGVEGALPGDFGYKLDADFANSAVGFGDVILSYAPKGKPWSATIGNHETFESLEQMSSSRFLSFLERAQMNDAFNHTRRLGVSFGLQDKANVLRFNAGTFTNHAIDASFDNDGFIAAARATYSPRMLGGMLHFGANYQYRRYQKNVQQARYRARPFLQTTDIRFVDTTAFAVRNDQVIGVELGGLFGPLHVVGEAQWLKADAFGAGDTVIPLDATGTTLVPGGDPSFFSWYAEVGYYLTGETRGYRNGKWDRTRVKNPFDKGGWGALQVNARYDFLDLTTGKLQNGFINNFTTGVNSTSVDLARGGEQTGYLASLIWIPQDYVRFLLQYTHAEVKGGPAAAFANPASAAPVDERKYGVDSVAMRAQFDF